MDAVVVISGYHRHLGEIEDNETALAPNGHQGFPTFGKQRSRYRRWPERERLG